MSDWPKGFLEFAEPVSGVTDVMLGGNAQPAPAPCASDAHDWREIDLGRMVCIRCQETTATGLFGPSPSTHR